MTYADKLQDPRWQAKRQIILQRDGHKCKMCGDIESSLHVHHKRYVGEPWESPDEDLITYCEHCHYLVTYCDYALLRVAKFPVFNKPKSYHIVTLYFSSNGHFIGTCEYDGFSKTYKHIDIIPEAHFHSISEFINVTNG